MIEDVTYTIAAFYRFIALAEPSAVAEEIRARFRGSDLLGTMLIAGEGVNGTMAGSAETIEELMKVLAERFGIARTDVKFSTAEERPFGRLKVRVKKEIIAFRKAVVDTTQAGEYVEPQEWNDLIADPEVLVLDTRNRYETEVGTFAGAIAPEIGTFSDFASYVREKLDPSKHRKVAMFCTGGIRCEKASAFMLQEGFGEVYHLKGGILKYLEDVPKQVSQWRGGCYIFDQRGSVGHEDFEG
jgi:UPF0176 protein